MCVRAGWGNSKCPFVFIFNLNGVDIQYLICFKWTACDYDYTHYEMLPMVAVVTICHSTKMLQDP